MPPESTFLTKISGDMQTLKFACWPHVEELTAVSRVSRKGAATGWEDSRVLDYMEQSPMCRLRFTSLIGIVCEMNEK